MAKVDYEELLDEFSRANMLIMLRQLKDCRNRRGWTQKQMAGRIGVNLKTYRSFESGDVLGAGWSLIPLALRALGMENQLLGLFAASGDPHLLEPPVIKRRAMDNDF